MRKRAQGTVIGDQKSPKTGGGEEEKKRERASRLPRKNTLPSENAVDKGGEGSIQRERAFQKTRWKREGVRLLTTN